MSAKTMTGFSRLGSFLKSVRKKSTTSKKKLFVEGDGVAMTASETTMTDFSRPGSFLKSVRRKSTTSKEKLFV